MKGGEVFTVEWSSTQDSFHVELLTEALAANLRCFGKKQPMDYVPLGIYDSHEEAAYARLRFRNWLDKHRDNPPAVDGE